MIKADRAGSIPDGTTSKELNSIAFRHFRQNMGQATFWLNTIVVGLDAVANGHPKPQTIDISWEPADRLTAARTARKFAVESTIVRCSDCLNTYVKEIGKFSRFKDLSSKWHTENSEKAQRLADLVQNLIGESYLAAAVVLVVHWRNRIIHSDSKADLKSKQRDLLLTNHEDIRLKYKGLEIELLLSHFRAARPTLKDVSSLIAMAMNCVRRMECNLFENLALEDVRALYEDYGLIHSIEKIRRETSPLKVEESIRRHFMTTAPQLLRYYPLIQK